MSLPYMPLWVADLVDAVRGWPDDPRNVYVWLLMAHWTELGILPDDSEQLQRLALVSHWPPERFAAAWDVIQGKGSWKKPKFDSDEFGLYNARGREIFAEKMALQINGHRGSLKQHGCPQCRQAGRPTRLGDGWVRHCPSCNTDLWARFQLPPWMPNTLPSEGDEPSSTTEPDEKSAERFARAVEEAAQRVLGFARPLSGDEGRLVLDWHRAGVPEGLVVEALETAMKKRKNKPPRSLRYFEPVVKEMVRERESLTATGTEQPETPEDSTVHSDAWEEAQLAYVQNNPEQGWRWV